MNHPIVQYGFTTLIVIFAVIYIVRLIRSTFKKKDDDNCGSGCDCK